MYFVKQYSDLRGGNLFNNEWFTNKYFNNYKFTGVYLFLLETQVLQILNISLSFQPDCVLQNNYYLFVIQYYLSTITPLSSAWK